MKKLILSLSIVAFLAFAGNSFAAAGVYGGYGVPCQPIYGGGETCVSKGNILINKTVQNPQSKGFVDNLSLSNDPKYGPDSTVTFQLTVSNTGDKELKDIDVTDSFPSYLSFVSGPGTFDTNSKTLTFNIPSLKANESKSYTIKGKVVNSSSLPADQAVNCVVNQAKAIADRQESSDLSQFCIEKTVTTTKGGIPVMDAPKGLKQTPSTGPEMLALIGLIPAGLGGLYLRRKTS